MRIRSITLAALAACSLALSACSAGSLGDSDSGGEGGKVELSFLVGNGEQDVKTAEQLVKDFSAKNPDITLKIEARPQGGEGDNLVKTRLSTGDMSDVFVYNTGSLFQAIAPEKNMVPLDDQPWVGQLDENFKTTVTAGGKVYGAPLGTFMAGAVMYNRAVYDKVGLQVPKTWAEFMANSAKIKAAGYRPDRPDLPGHLDLAAVRAGRLPQRRGGRARLRRAVHEEPGQVRHLAGRHQGLPAPAGGA